MHETIHALDIETPGPESLLVELRRELAAVGVEPRATRDWVHTLFFQEVDGIRRARRMQSENPASGRTVLTFERIESGLELGDDVFSLPDPDAEEVTEN